MGAPRPPELRAEVPPEWAIDCPNCPARGGAPCRTPTGRRLSIDSHPSRAEAWRRRATS
jgi:hypothetical protein